MLAYNYNESGFLLGTVTCQPNPRSPGDYLSPSNSTQITPPSEIPQGKIPRFNFETEEWSLVDLPTQQNSDAQEMPVVDLLQVKWNKIRSKRDSYLRSLVDPQVPYLTWGHLSVEQIEKFRIYRQALLDVPQQIQGKIDSGEIVSILDLNVETYAWPEL